MFTKRTLFSLYSPSAPRPCGSFQYPRSFPSSSSSRASESSQTGGITKGCGSAVLITRNFVTFAAGVCSRYRYLQSQLHWQHTQRILGALLNSQTRRISFCFWNSVPSFIFSKYLLSFSIDDLMNAAVWLLLQHVQLFSGISLCALSLQSVLNGVTILL